MIRQLRGAFLVVLFAALMIPLSRGYWSHGREGFDAWNAILRLGGAYRLNDADHADHADAMISGTVGEPTRIISVLFVGNSLTAVNDLPAMLVNIASSDPGNTVRLIVKAETWPGANLEFLRDRTGALDWARTHRPDYVVLQPRSHWYASLTGVNATWREVLDWRDVLRPMREAPMLFAVWGDDVKSEYYSNPAYHAPIHDPVEDARYASQWTAWLGNRVEMPTVAVGEAFERVRIMPSAPDPYGPDRHHPSIAGTYLAALVFYRVFTGRTGADATWRPWGLSQRDAAWLARASVP